MTKLPNCPQCDSEFTYEDGPTARLSFMCHEWSPADEATAAEAELTRDANGNVLVDGDTVIVIKDSEVQRRRREGRYESEEHSHRRRRSRHRLQNRRNRRDVAEKSIRQKSIASACHARTWHSPWPKIGCCMRYKHLTTRLQIYSLSYAGLLRELRLGLR